MTQGQKGPRPAVSTDLDTYARAQVKQSAGCSPVDPVHGDLQGVGIAWLAHGAAGAGTLKTCQVEVSLADLKRLVPLMSGSGYYYLVAQHSKT